MKKSYQEPQAVVLSLRSPFCTNDDLSDTYEEPIYGEDERDVDDDLFD